MALTGWQIVLLAIVQGLAELLPVSSSAHVIAAAKLMRIDPSSPPFTLLLVMLHTGTMFAVIVYFWQAWKRAFFSSRERFIEFAGVIIIATVVTGVVGGALKVGLEHLIAHHLNRQGQAGKAEIEELFKHLQILAAALAAAGLLIVYSGLRSSSEASRDEISSRDAVAVGAVQGLSLPFRGFSRSGSTISVGLLRGVSRRRMEEYSFALAVVLTPVVVAWEARRLMHSQGRGEVMHLGIHDLLPSLIGMIFSFIAGLVALKILSRLLEHGKWWVFGIYCFAAAVGCYVMYLQGY